MTPPAEKPVHPLLARSVQLRVYAALRRWTVEPETMSSQRGEHLNWVIEQERNGTLFLSGPVKTCGDEKTVLHGLMVLRAPDSATASEIARQDPYVRAGAMSVEVFEWTIYEGCFPINVRISDSSVCMT